MAAPRRFFSRRLPLIYNVALLLLMVTAFLLPFALRGARMAVDGMKNNVADWLPSDYEETVDLGEFRKYFIGDQFVVLSGPWCKEGNPTYTNLRRKIFEESMEYERFLHEQKGGEEIIRAHRKGDDLGLMISGSLHEDWGQYSERWLKGNDEKWYWINRNGELYRWEGENNVLEGLKRFVERAAIGRNHAGGTYIDRFGEYPDDASGVPNMFYSNPELLCARPFKSVTSGPDALAQMAGPGGTLRIGDVKDDELSAFESRVEAHKRLSGALFGPTPKKDFNWTFDSLLQTVEDNGLREQLEKSEDFRFKFDVYMQREIDRRFNGDRTGLVNATESERLDLWLRMWDAIGLDAPPRQTCLVVTINTPFLEELDRIVGSSSMAKPRGRLLEIATGKCGLAAENVHMGGPPSDNVAIDEEGTKTLLRLAFLSGLIGIVLAYYSFRSIRVTAMIFFVGGVSAIASLSYVWYFGSRLDAILMTMPSLIYVLAMSGAVHLINYYKDACEEHGHKRAVDVAVQHGWFPCAVASFTTAIGLFSLCMSNLTPIYKFGFFSAIATIATLFFLYTFLPAALTLWPPHYRFESRGSNKKATGASSGSLVANFWDKIYVRTVRYPWLVIGTGMLLIVVFGVGVTKIQTTVQLLKLFDKEAKVLKDYAWMEKNLGKLVPMEIVINVDERAQQEVLANAALPKSSDESAEIEKKRFLRYSFLERMEISSRIRKQLERFFGPDGCDVVGAGMATDVFIPMQSIADPLDNISSVSTRSIFNIRLLDQRKAMTEQDYFAVTDVNTLKSTDDNIYSNDPNYANREMWRISLRLAALEDINYGDFVSDLKMVVEPVLWAYEYRTEILGKLFAAATTPSSKKNTRILILGRDPREIEKHFTPIKTVEEARRSIDQDYLFSTTIKDLLMNRGIDSKKIIFLDPTAFNADRPFPDDQVWADQLEVFSLVVMIEDSPYFDKEFISEHSKAIVDCREHRYELNAKADNFESSKTAMNRKTAGEDLAVTATYTGIVPIVYKAQGALLRSLIESIALSFVMISLVMMILLRDWSAPLTFRNLLNVQGGLISMIPNVFPIVLIFGAMGFLRIKVDIGSMMTASVAMGIAVDDTIHFLNWYRDGLANGNTRWASIRIAYSRCASAMTQTTLIAGLGLSVFALSTFAPTQRFGVLMLLLLAAALIGDLILLPALLASPLGRFFGKERVAANGDSEIGDGMDSNEIKYGEGAITLRVIPTDADQDNQRGTQAPPNQRLRNSS